MVGVAGEGFLMEPFGGVGLLGDAGELDEAAPVAEGFADAVEALLVLHVHAAEVGGEVEVVGEKDEDGLGVGAAAVGFEGGEFFLFWLRGCRGP